MKVWSDWQVLRRQVAIGGQVVDGNNKPVAGVQVTLTGMPDAFKQKLKHAADAAETAWDDLEKRPDRTQSRRDGIYFFLDLPDGSYTLNAIDPRTDQQDEQTASVSNAKRQTVKMAHSKKWKWRNTDFKLAG